ncbi:SDR family oxidoreductase [Amycolatopsis acidiphila]|uniref:SDR family oxidoreductase n=1 Tax=Amycolatopsis acidiphila TaxID=715473 RepID=A0A558AP96_9PSEU|nr:SDR family oxidoreductase [Amycolatopsis acidiphila]TVT26079.1 SDR family oxidoreductase [Amycolatopsis acidiphila]UIJ63195.1 SDR family oxidoreductase [Amycolatopsis acidiphila]GHG74269.1 NAD-dependent epimerase [Amycolatopsis acidiphila]
MIAVTGSASGIGAAVVPALRAEGHDVIGVDLRDAQVRADLGTPDGRQRAIDGVLDRCGGSLEGLVLCAGLGPHTPDPVRIIEVNYRGAVTVLDGLFPALRTAAVAVSSSASTMVRWADNPIARGEEAAALADAGEYRGQLAYAWSKNALTVAVRSRVAEWGAAGVRLNTVAPGAVDTPLLAGGLADPRYGDAIRNYRAPIPRHGRPAEVAALIVYLLGPRAGYVHGAQFMIDGGSDALMRPTEF